MVTYLIILIVLKDGHKYCIGEHIMSEEKKSKNPFINMANAAKKAQVGVPGSQPQPKAPKPTKGFGGGTVTRKVGRGR